MKLLFTLILILTGLTASAPRLCAAEKSADEPVTILGQAVVDAESMWKFVSEVNADFPLELARHYYEVGTIYGIRGDIALCQAIIETGWFRFDKGTAVKPDQHNYCGLGVLKRGMKGHSFETPRDGVTAQIQHLYAYASTSPLPDGEQKLDKRFGLVNRGSALTWEELSGKWAANPRYGSDILNLYERMMASAGKYMQDAPQGAADNVGDKRRDFIPMDELISKANADSDVIEDEILKESFTTSTSGTSKTVIEPQSDKNSRKDPRVRRRRR